MFDGISSLKGITSSNEEEFRLTGIKEVFRSAERKAFSFSPVLENPFVLHRYLMDSYPILSLGDQDFLARVYVKFGDEEAAKILILTNLRLAAKLSLKYWRQGIDKLELIQEGNVGLIRAVRSFDPNKGLQFIAYAKFWILQRIFSFLKKLSLISGKTRAARKLFFHRKRIERKLLLEGKEMTPELLAQELGVSESDAVASMTFMDQPLMSLHGEGNQEEFPISFFPDQEKEVIEKDLLQKFHIAITEFSSLIEGERERQIFLLRTVAGENALTLDKLGKIFKITKERVRQLDNKMKGKFSSYFLENFN